MEMCGVDSNRTTLCGQAFQNADTQCGHLRPAVGLHLHLSKDGGQSAVKQKSAGTAAKARFTIDTAHTPGFS
jgi:hypothetical protein